MFDLSKITVTDSDESLSRAPGAGRHKIENPFGDVILDSWKNQKNDVGSTKVLTVTEDADKGKNGEPRNVTTIKGLIRRAAEDNNLGVKLVVTSKDGKATIKFAAKVKTERTRTVKDETDETSVAIVAAPPVEVVKPKPAPPVKVPAKV